MKTLVIGLGNPILTDDGVGVLVARAVIEALEGAPEAEIDVIEVSVGGLRLMEMMIGYDKAIIIDALAHGETPPGVIQRLTLADLEAISPTQHTASAHDTNLATAMAMGRRMDLLLPEDIVIYTVAVENIIDFGDQPTPAVQQAIPLVTETVLKEIQKEP